MTYLKKGMKELSVVFSGCKYDVEVMARDNAPKQVDKRRDLHMHESMNMIISTHKVCNTQRASTLRLIHGFTSTRHLDTFSFDRTAKKATLSSADKLASVSRLTNCGSLNPARANCTN